MLYMSTAASHIIVEDLPVGEDIRGVPGSKRMLSIAPDKAVNLSLLDPDAVAKSQILKRLIKAGILVPCSPAAADQAESESAQQALQEEKDRLEQAAPLVPEGITAEEFAESQASRTGLLLVKPGDYEVAEGEGQVSEPNAEVPLDQAKPGELTMEQTTALINASEGGDAAPRVKQDAF